MNKKELYESIMKNVSREVKKALNEQLSSDLQHLVGLQSDGISISFDGVDGCRTSSMDAKNIGEFWKYGKHSVKWKWESEGQPEIIISDNNGNELGRCSTYEQLEEIAMQDIKNAKNSLKNAVPQDENARYIVHIIVERGGLSLGVMHGYSDVDCIEELDATELPLSKSAFLRSLPEPINSDKDIKNAATWAAEEFPEIYEEVDMSERKFKMLFIKDVQTADGYVVDDDGFWCDIYKIMTAQQILKICKYLESQEWSAYAEWRRYW